MKETAVYSAYILDPLLAIQAIVLSIAIRYLMSHSPQLADPICMISRPDSKGRHASNIKTHDIHTRFQNSYEEVQNPYGMMSNIKKLITCT